MPVDEKLCEEKHRRVDQRQDWVERDIAGIKRQITATLVFAFVTLVTVIVILVR